MALFKSQVLTQASGSVGGLTYTRTPSGMVIRARSMPVNPSTNRQQIIRGAVSTLATYWVETMSDSERQGWIDYAANVTRRNKLGDQIHISGLNEFIRSNSIRLQTGNAMVVDAPTIYDTGAPMEGGVITQAETTPFAVTLTWTGAADPSTTAVIYVSKPQNSTINFFKGPYQLQEAVGAGPGTATLTPGAGWVAGNKIFVRARLYYEDGRLSAATEYSFLLTGTPV